MRMAEAPNSILNLDDREGRPAIDSQFRLIVVAALRSKQLVRGASARIEPSSLRRRSTSIAVEEVKRGLVLFTISKPD